MRKKWIAMGILAAGILAAAWRLLGEDFFSFFVWWLMVGILGLLTQPLTGRLFAGFADRGWMFSKILGFLIPGYLTWVLVVAGVLPFTGAVCVGVTAFWAVLMLILNFRDAKERTSVFPEGQWSLVCWEEILFLFFFLMWTYLAGFHPEAYGTEKFMDYGFMEAMMRSTTLPARDLWYSQENINYYYGGQYYAVFLTKLTGTQVAVTYNLMRTLIAGLMFALPCSLVCQLLRDRLGGDFKGKKRLVPPLGGLLAGMAVSLAGNMHYVIYAWIWPWLADRGLVEERADYWFPDATRYIGHDPETADQTIHEFPCYSFVLGDLHAHMINLIFVILLLGILYAWMRRRKSQAERELEVFGKKQICRELLQPGILMLYVYLLWTNYWDFVIYYVVTGGCVLFINIITYRGKIRQVLTVTFLQAVEVMAAAMLTALPFTLTFESMTKGVALAQNHSAFYQLCVLWGLPSVLVLLYVIQLLWGRMRQKVHTDPGGISAPDLYILVLGLCALGLILIPELVYVRDIYENGSARSNTMFKLTYQAYLMFADQHGIHYFPADHCVQKKNMEGGRCGGLKSSSDDNRIFRQCGAQLVRTSLGSIPLRGNGCHTVSGDRFSGGCRGYPLAAENISGSPVVLEADGYSYTGYARVSAMTGLPYDSGVVYASAALERR